MLQAIDEVSQMVAERGVEATAQPAPAHVKPAGLATLFTLELIQEILTVTYQAAGGLGAGQEGGRAEYSNRLRMVMELLCM